MMRDRSFQSLVAEGSARLGVELAGEQVKLIVNYLDLLIKWNKSINLVRVRDEQDLVTHHVIDSLALARHIPADATRLVDVGSGAGFPGAIVAMARPDIQVTVLEPIHKKHAFLATVRRELSLANFHPNAERLEEHRSSPLFCPYDVAVSRATFAVPEWLDVARGLVCEGGLILAMEGAEQHALPEGATRHPYHLDRKTRAIIELRVS